MAAAASRVEFANNVLGQLSVGRLGSSRAFQAWIIAEIGTNNADGGLNQGGRWNPLNTTLWWPNSSNYNSTGVKNYKTFSDGVAATVSTLQEPQYENVVETMQQADIKPDTVLQAIAASPWAGGSPSYLDSLRAALAAYMSNRAFYNELGVGPQ